MKKYETLQQLLIQPVMGGLMVAYSGGVDSAFLLWAAEQQRRSSGGKLVAITGVSDSLSRTEREDATRFAQFVGVEHRWEKTGEVENPNYIRNDHLRCYHCKTELFRVSRITAGQLGLHYVAYGFNASDRSDYRPGHQAAGEAGVISPLCEAGLTKDEIRTLMREFGLPLADKPSSPCLSSRLMTGVSVTSAKLKDIEDMEAMVRALGASVFRMRLHENDSDRWLRLEVGPADIHVVVQHRNELVAAAQALGFRWLTLDLAGYRMGGAAKQ